MHDSACGLWYAIGCQTGSTIALDQTRVMHCFLQSAQLEGAGRVLVPYNPIHGGGGGGGGVQIPLSEVSSTIIVRDYTTRFQLSR